MNIIIDMNLSPRWVHAFADAGLEARHWSDIGQASASDAVIMQTARGDDAIVLTNDLDFGAILAATDGDGPSVVQLRANDLSPDVIGPRVIKIMLSLTAELSAGALVTIDATKERVALLPLVRNKSP